jgi:hypothetical protein
MAVTFALSLIFLLQMVPTKNPAWSAGQIADFYAQNQTRIIWGAVICSWTGAFMMPILTVLAVQMSRVESGGVKIWSALSLVSGALMSLFLALPPLFWGVAAYTAPRRNPEVTALMHELGSLTLVTTDQFYIFLWVCGHGDLPAPGHATRSSQPVPAVVGVWLVVDNDHVRSGCLRIRLPQRTPVLGRPAGVLVTAGAVRDLDQRAESAAFPCPAPTRG